MIIFLIKGKFFSSFAKLRADKTHVYRKVHYAP